MDPFGTLGGLWTNKENIEFAEEMASTQYQRATADMKAAGLNPNAIFGSGGGSPAAAPGGQATNPVAGGFGSSAQGVANLASSLAQTQNTMETNALIKAQADTARSTARAAASGADVQVAENTAYKKALAGPGGEEAAVLNKFGKGGGAAGFLGGAAGLLGLGASNVVGGRSSAAQGPFSGDSVAKKLGHWWGSK